MKSNSICHDLCLPRELNQFPKRGRKLEHIETTFIGKRFPSIFRLRNSLRDLKMHIIAVALKSIKLSVFIAPSPINFPSAVQRRCSNNHFPPGALPLSPGVSSNCRCNIN
jgi:hypothetical protein